MLPRSERLSKAFFATSPAGAVRATTAHFSLQLSPATVLEQGCAVVISKKIARLSVTRHLLRRRVLTLLRPWSKSPHCLVVYARAGSSKLSFKELQEELVPALERLALLSGKV